MTIFDNYEVWFVIGSQICMARKPCVRSPNMPSTLLIAEYGSEAALQTGVETAGHHADEITAICRDANYDDRCAGL